MYGVIYKRTNLINNKVYIGQTIQNPEKRWTDEDKSMQLIGQKVREYGKENFKNEIIDFADNAEDLDKKEAYYISLYNSVVPSVEKSSIKIISFSKPKSTASTCLRISSSVFFSLYTGIRIEILFIFISFFF